jgi:hypothetical protein
MWRRLWRPKSIAVPRDKPSCDGFASEDVDDTTQADVLWLNDDNLFWQIWNSGLFDALNDDADSLIGDYETEKLTPPQLALAMPRLLDMKLDNSPVAALAQYDSKLAAADDQQVVSDDAALIAEAEGVGEANVTLADGAGTATASLADKRRVFARATDSRLHQ